MIELRNACKGFTLHSQGGAVITVMEDASLTVAPGECIALTGASGAGKSTLMRLIYRNYLTASKQVLVAGLDVAQAKPRELLALRGETLGYVGLFLRVVATLPILDVLAEPLLAVGIGRQTALDKVAALLARLNISERLWGLSATTFSCGDQQQVNTAPEYPAMHMDEPTDPPDVGNRETVLFLFGEAKVRGTAIVGIFRDVGAGERGRDRKINVSDFTPEVAA